MQEKLKDIATLVNGYAFKSSNYTSNGIRVIRIANVQNGYLSDESPCFYPIEFSEKLKDANLYENDLLMSLTGNVGRVAIMTKEFLPAGLNQRVECIRPKNTMDNEYLYFYFRSPAFQKEVSSATTGCAQQNLSTKWLSEHEIPMYQETKRLNIVNILKNIDKLISIKNTELKSLEDLVKSRFICQEVA